MTINICTSSLWLTEWLWSLTIVQWEGMDTSQPSNGSLNWVPALAGGKVGIVTLAGWQVTLCVPMWHVIHKGDNTQQHVNVSNTGWVFQECDTLVLEGNCEVHFWMPWMCFWSDFIDVKVLRELLPLSRKRSQLLDQFLRESESS